MARTACPAVKTLDLALRTAIPFLSGNYKETNGKYLPRLQTTGNPRHQMGICLDIILFAKPWNYDKSVDWEKEVKLGETLVQLFIGLRDVMKWTEIIYQDRRFWEPDKKYTKYTQDDKHKTHIHIDWMFNDFKGKGKSESEIIKNSPRANTTDFYGVLLSYLDVINYSWENDTIANVDLTTINP